MLRENLKRAYYAFGLVIIFASMLISNGADSPIASLYFSNILLIYAAVGIITLKVKFNTVFFIGAGLFIIFIAFAFLKGFLVNGLDEYAALGVGLLLLWIFRHAGLNYDTGRWVWRATLYALGVLALLSLINFAYDPSSWLGQARAYHLNRLAGPFLSANTAGSVFGVAMLLSVFHAYRRSLSLAQELTGVRAFKLILERRWFDWLLGASCLGALMLTGSRAGIILSILALFIMIAFGISRPQPTAQQQWGRLGIAAGLCLLALIIILSLDTLVLDRFNTRDITHDGRWRMFEAYWRTLHFNLWFGAGLGGFDTVSMLAATPENFSLLSAQNSAHNLVLQWLLQGGLIFMSLFSALWAAICIAKWRGLNSIQRGRHMVMLSLSSFILVFIHSQVDFALEIPSVFWLMCCIWGLGLGLSQRRQQCKKTSRRTHIIVKSTICAGLVITLVPLATLTSRYVLARNVLSWSEDQVQNYHEQGHRYYPAHFYLNLAYRKMVMNEPQLEDALRYSEHAVALQPRDGHYWLYLAYAQSLTQGEPETITRSLENSYYYQPFARTDYRRLRLDLVRMNWGIVSPSVKTYALREVRLEPQSRQDEFPQP